MQIEKETPMNIAVAERTPSRAQAHAKPAVISERDRFLFDLNGFLVLPGAIAEQDRAEMLAEVERLEQLDHDDSHWRHPRADGKVSQQTKQSFGGGQLRLNGLLRLTSAFDRLIDYP